MRSNSRDGLKDEERGCLCPLSRRRLLLGGAWAVAGALVLPAEPARAAAPELVSNVETYRTALARLAQNYKYALIDIRADWCAVCHRIEGEILSHASVQRLLDHVALLKVDVTAMDGANRQLLSYLRADGPPTFFFADTATGEEYARTRSVGSFRRHDLIRRLQPFARAS